MTQWLECGLSATSVENCMYNMRNILKSFQKGIPLFFDQANHSIQNLRIQSDPNWILKLTLAAHLWIPTSPLSSTIAWVSCGS